MQTMNKVVESATRFLGPRPEWRCAYPVARLPDTPLLPLSLMDTGQDIPAFPKFEHLWALRFVHIAGMNDRSVIGPVLEVG